MRESDLYIQVASYLNMQYPGISYHFDLSGVNNPSIPTRVLYSKLNGSGYPDLLIAAPRGTCSGLFLEIKVVGEKIYKRDGKTFVSDHVSAQARYLEHLQTTGYMASFGIGFDHIKMLIDGYLSHV